MRPVEMKKSREAIADLPTQASLSLLLEPSSQGGGGGGPGGPALPGAPAAVEVRG